MKKILVGLVIIFLGFSISCVDAQVDYKGVVSEFLKSKGTNPAALDIRGAEDTTSPDWKLVVVYARRGTMKQPIPFFVSKDGSTVVPNTMIFVKNEPIVKKALQPEYDKITTKFSEEDRRVINPEGKKKVFLFTDPDCPFCKKVDEKLKDYKGDYKVIIKSFPLEQIHPEAKKKAVALQAEWLMKTKGMSKEDAQKEAEKLVAEDMAEGMKAGVAGTPFFVAEDGTVLQTIF